MSATANFFRHFIRKIVIGASLIIFANIVWCAPGSAFAATGSSIPFPLVMQQTSSLASSSPQTGVNCFDYYHFGSVQTDISSGSSNAVPGMTMQFSGMISNSNSYPIVDGTLYVKIMREKGFGKDANGPDIVDQFIAVNNIDIPANSSVKTAFSWKVPLYSLKGDYRVASYFVTDKKFNLLGLSFTDDVIGNTFDFMLGGQSSIVDFDKTAVKINGNPFFFAAFPPKISAGESANISAKVVNSTAKDETVSITWKLYDWDSIDPDNLKETISTSTLVRAHSSKNVFITIPDKEAPVYYLVGELSYKDTKSILNIRFVRSGVDRLRLNFPSTMQFPVMAGTTSTIFSCLSNSGTSDIVPNGKLILELKDSAGKTINSYTYQGPVTGNMMAVKSDFVAKKDADNFILSASLWQAGKLVDEATVVYNCDSVDPSKCARNSALQGSGGNNLMTIIYYLLGLILLALIAFGSFVLIHKKKMKANNVTYLLVLLLLPMSILAFPRNSEAASVQWVGHNSEKLEYFWNREGKLGRSGETSGWSYALDQNANIDVNYNVSITNATSGATVSSGAVVPVGTQLLLKFQPHTSNDLSWSGTGYSVDSPNGEWKATTDPDPVLCSSSTPNDFVNLYSFNYPNPDSWLYTYGVYIPFVVAYPSKTISTSTNNMTCDPVSGNETIGYSTSCTVATPGLLNPTFNFGPTTGKFYYRYWDYNDYGNLGSNPRQCYGNNVSLQPESNVAYGNQVLKNPSADYFISVQAQSISYNLTATSVPATNHAPLPPTIGCSTCRTGVSGGFIGLSGRAYSFTASSSDQDGDQIKYHISWDGDGTTNQSYPVSVSEFTGAGTTTIADANASPVPTGKSWAAGPYTFKVRVEDSHGAFSGWTSVPIAIYDMPTTGLSVDHGSIAYNGQVTLSWTPTNSTSCSAAGGNSGDGWAGIKSIVGGSLVMGSLLSDVSYSLTCGNPAASTTDQEQIIVTPLVGPLNLHIGYRSVATMTKISVPIGQSFALSWVIPTGVDPTKDCQVTSSPNIQTWNDGWLSAIQLGYTSTAGIPTDPSIAPGVVPSTYYLSMTCSNSAHTSNSSDSVVLRVYKSDLKEN